MSDLLEKCSVCRALIDEEDLFCANCGAEAPKREHEESDTSQTFKHNFECQGCGASMSYDAEAQTLQCPFCGSDKLEDKPDVKSLAPRRVVPFAVDHDSAVAAMREWLGRGFWRPSDLSERAAVHKMSAVYVPYWVFTARTFTYWTADSSQTPLSARGDWVPMSGEHRGNYAGLLIGASSVLTPSETSAICPFNLAEAVPPDQVDLQHIIAEQFRVQRKYARPQARQGLENMESQACAQYVPGRSRNLKVNVRMEGLSSEPMLLPVWVMAYRYQDRVFRFLLNGQTGRATGQAPTSWKKVFMAIGIAILVVLLILLCIAGVSAVMNAKASEPASFYASRSGPVSAMISRLPAVGSIHHGGAHTEDAERSRAGRRATGAAGR
jgi:hypothetical protein